MLRLQARENMKGCGLKYRMEQRRQALTEERVAAQTLSFHDHTQAF
ncbi:MAG: hypothetical protein ACJASY_004442 [Halioglobus sp.]|jgi:hypothetical protein